jgi:hypothetical protein
MITLFALKMGIKAGPVVLPLFDFLSRYGQ